MKSNPHTRYTPCTGHSEQNTPSETDFEPTMSLEKSYASFKMARNIAQRIAAKMNRENTEPGYWTGYAVVWRFDGVRWVPSSVH